MRIPGFIFVLVGAVITYISYYVGPKLAIFFWIGLISLGYGIFEILIKFMLRERASTKFKKEVREQVKKQRVVHCPKCHTAVFRRAHFCYHCGYRLK